MSEPDPNAMQGWLEQLRSSIAILHEDSRAQQQWLTDLFVGQHGVVVDELALTFDDVWMEGKIAFASTLPSEARERLGELDRALSAMSGSDHAELWTVEALATRHEWVEIRALAAKAIAALTQ